MPTTAAGPWNGLARWAWRLRHLEPPLWVLLALSGAAITLSLSGTVPPWPPGVGPMTALMTTSAALALARWRDRHETWFDHRARLLAALLLTLGAAVFLALLSRYTFSIPGTGEMGVKGFVCTPEARLIYPLTCPDHDQDALRSAEYEATRIWQPWSVDLVRLGLLTGWTLAWGAMSLLAAALARPIFRDLIRSAPEPASGPEPYLFVSYAHADFARVRPVLELLDDAGQRLWYDKGLEGTTDWETGLATRLQGCQAVLWFMSPVSVTKPWVLKEISYADTLGKPIFVARIGDTPWPTELVLRMNRNQVIEGDPEEIAQRCLQRFGPSPPVG